MINCAKEIGFVLGKIVNFVDVLNQHKGAYGETI